MHTIRNVLTWSLIDLHLRQSKSVFHAASTVVARAVPAGFALAEIPRSTGTLGYHIHAYANKGGSVRVHHVRQVADIEGVRTTAFAHLVLVVTLVDADHSYVDSHIFLDLSITNV